MTQSACVVLARGMLTFILLHLDPVFFGVPVCLSVDLEEAAAVQLLQHLSAVAVLVRHPATGAFVCDLVLIVRPYARG